MNKLIRALFALSVVAALAILLVWGFQRNRKEQGEENQSLKPPVRVTTTSSGENVVTLDARAQASIGLKTEAVQSAAVQPEVLAYGALVEDPSRSFTIRAPVAGTLRRLASGSWPAIGDTLDAGTEVGRLEARLAPAERLNLRDRLASAQAELESAAAAVAVSRPAHDRATKLNADDKNVSDRTVEESEARLKSDEAHLKAAKETVGLLAAALGDAGRMPEGLFPLIAERGGQVVEVLSQPGESVEGGQAVLRVARFDQLLAKVELPAGETIAEPAPAAWLIVLGHENRPIPATGAGLAASVDSKTLAQSLLFRVQDPGLNLRPGMAVTAHIRQPGAGRSGAVVPRSAVVRFAGRAWVYVQASAGGFTRREISLDRPVENGWVTAILHGGERVVVVGAQTLLSEELKSQIQLGEANEAQ